MLYFTRSIMSSMMGSSRASLDSVTDEISEPTHGHGFAGLQGSFCINPFLPNMCFRFSATCISRICIKIKINLKCLFSHFVVVPQKILWRPLKPSIFFHRWGLNVKGWNFLLSLGDQKEILRRNVLIDFIFLIRCKNFNLTLWAPTPQNGQKHSSNFPARANELF